MSETDCSGCFSYSVGVQLCFDADNIFFHVWCKEFKQIQGTWEMESTVVKHRIWSQES